MNTRKISKQYKSRIEGIGLIYDLCNRKELFRDLIAFLQKETGVSYQAIEDKAGIYKQKGYINKICTKKNKDGKLFVTVYNVDFDAVFAAYPYHTLLFLFDGDSTAAGYFADRVKLVLEEK